MATIALTDSYVRSLKAERGRRLDRSDALCTGLTIRVSGSGRKQWLLRYWSADGVQRRHVIGELNAFSLKAARLEVGRLKELISRGVDPVQDRRQAREQAKREAQNSFGKLAETYFHACETGEWQPKRKRKRGAVLAYERRLYARHIEPALGSMPHLEIRRCTVKDLLRGMIAKGIRSQTNRVHAIIRQIFNYAISEDLAETNPATGFQSFHTITPRRRIWKDPELKRLWNVLTTKNVLLAPDDEEVQVSRPVRIAIQLAALLLQRRNEIAGMMLEELDLEQAVWVIAPERMKGGRPHQVPLPPLAIRLIREAIDLCDLPGRIQGPVFPNPRDHTTPIDPSALTRALGRIRDAIGVEDATVHDLRRTGSTALTSERLRVSPFIRSKVLGHDTDAGGGAQVSSVHYDVNEYMTEKRAALAAWERLLLSIVRPRDEQPPRLQTGIIRGMVFGLEVANDTSGLPSLYSR
ncbi:site-specific integrase [Brevundimonas sp.]|uniref:tyrosine-type recombinase/integrase n=1 Tax=Brevundimonas sp. TaxID=1871086 RepID=UPI0019ACFBB9|nr:site-specific integrase [Brevundimonas sp.]MBD3836997.1 integrase arm-type DNA-binding domain-containing protein [Brevundimonas sp.]